MTGLLLIFVVLIWAALVAFISKVLTQKLHASNWRIPVAMLIYAVLLPLPLIDEIVGGRQFKQLCEENSTISIDRAKAMGKTVYYVPEPSVEIQKIWLKIVRQSYRYIDAQTADFVVGYSTLAASGGLFIRWLGISEGGMPLTFHGTCGPPDTKNLFKELAITALDRP